MMAPDGGGNDAKGRKKMKIEKREGLQLEREGEREARKEKNADESRRWVSNHCL